jgi:hypothetical protein
MADPGNLKRIDEPQGEETKGSRERSRPATGQPRGRFRPEPSPTTAEPRGSGPARQPAQLSVTARSKDSSNAPSTLRASTWTRPPASTTSTNTTSAATPCA